MAVRAQYSAAGIARARASQVAGGPNPGGLANPQNTAAGTKSTATGQVNTGAGATTPSVSPYLTSNQIAAYTNAYGKDLGTINGAVGQRATAYNKFAQESAVNGARAATSFNNTNQADAARGFGFSGIHDNAMADIQANAVMNQNNYNTAYSTALGQIGANVINAQNDLGNLNAEYGGIAAENGNALAGQLGTTMQGNWQAPAVQAPVTAPVTPTAPVSYFNNPNMGAINSLISQGAALGGSS